MIERKHVVKCGDTHARSRAEPALRQLLRLNLRIVSIVSLTLPAT